MKAISKSIFTTQITPNVVNKLSCANTNSLLTPVTSSTTTTTIATNTSIIKNNNTVIISPSVIHNLHTQQIKHMHSSCCKPVSNLTNTYPSSQNLSSFIQQPVARIHHSHFNADSGSQSHKATNTTTHHHSSSHPHVKPLVKPSRGYHFVFLGAPGVGKGTFAKRVSLQYSIPTISSGDLVRAEIKANTARGKMIRTMNDQGLLVPDDVMIDMTKQRLSQPDVANGFILDGFPRTIKQAETLESFIAPTLVIDLRLPENLLVLKITSRRVCSNNNCGALYNLADIKQGNIIMHPLLPRKSGVCDECGSELTQRSDDSEATVRRRLQAYHEQTKPLIHYYEKRQVLTHFAVEKGVEDTPRLLQHIAAFAH